jgi:glycerol uptake facilitator-like aquaporin
MAIGDERNLKIPKTLQPLVLAFVIGVHCIAFGYNEGAPLNPARYTKSSIFFSKYQTFFTF